MEIYECANSSGRTHTACRSPQEGSNTNDPVISLQPQLGFKKKQIEIKQSHPNAEYQQAEKCLQIGEKIRPVIICPRRTYRFTQNREPTIQLTLV